MDGITGGAAPLVAREEVGSSLMPSRRRTVKEIESDTRTFEAFFSSTDWASVEERFRTDGILGIYRDAQFAMGRKHWASAAKLLAIGVREGDLRAAASLTKLSRESKASKYASSLFLAWGYQRRLESLPLTEEEKYTLLTEILYLYKKVTMYQSGHRAWEMPTMKAIATIGSKNIIEKALISGQISRLEVGLEERRTLCIGGGFLQDLPTEAEDLVNRMLPRQPSRANRNGIAYRERLRAVFAKCFSILRPPPVEIPPMVVPLEEEKKEEDVAVDEVDSQVGQSGRISPDFFARWQAQLWLERGEVRSSLFPPGLTSPSSPFGDSFPMAE
ncbi:MAG: hypothetical protein JSR76_03885 [Verrucomicrobia bacterium]|nr:hypothetical protein [Verrucomicrobiota bacterium]